MRRYRPVTSRKFHWQFKRNWQNRETFLPLLRLHNISYQQLSQEVFGLSDISLTDNSHCEAD